MLVLLTHDGMNPEEKNLTLKENLNGQLRILKNTISWVELNRISNLTFLLISVHLFPAKCVLILRYYNIGSSNKFDGIMINLSSRKNTTSRIKINKRGLITKQSIPPFTHIWYIYIYWYIHKFSIYTYIDICISSHDLSYSLSISLYIKFWLKNNLE